MPADSNLGALVATHDISAEADARRAASIRKLQRLFYLPIFLLLVGLVGSYFDKGNPQEAQTRIAAIEITVALLIGCFALIAGVRWLGKSGDKAARRSHIKIYDHGLMLCEAARWGDGSRDRVCFWDEVAAVRHRTLGALVLGLTVTKVDGTSLFLARSFADLEEVEARFTTLGKMST